MCTLYIHRPSDWCSSILAAHRVAFKQPNLLECRTASWIWIGCVTSTAVRFKPIQFARSGWPLRLIMCIGRHDNERSQQRAGYRVAVLPMRTWITWYAFGSTSPTQTEAHPRRLAGIQYASVHEASIEKSEFTPFNSHNSETLLQLKFSHRIGHKSIQANRFKQITVWLKAISWNDKWLPEWETSWQVITLSKLFIITAVIIR